MNAELFKFKTQIRVRSYEIDWQGIVHNANYLLYFEVGRLDYLKHLGVTVEMNTIQNNAKVVLVRNEINYKSPARFNDLLDVYTRISYIQRTSFAFEGYIEESVNKRLIAENVAVHVWLDPRSGEPVLINDELRRMVQAFEGNAVSIDWPNYPT